MERLPTHIPSIDDVLQGGIPRYSVTVVTGAPGAGKTVLTLQTMFNNAKHGAKCIYFTTLSEPAIKLIHYSQEFEFFEESLVGDRFKIIDIGDSLRCGAWKGTKEHIQTIVEAEQPDIVAVDSFRAIRDFSPDTASTRVFAYDLSATLAAWSTTTFLVGEYESEEVARCPEFAVADVIIALGYDLVGLASQRTFQVVKMRGSGFASGKHFIEIDSSGIRLYPRFEEFEMHEPVESGARVPSGVAGLDELLHGGLPEWSTTTIKGVNGVGKTTLGLHLVAKRTRQDERGTIFTFEEGPKQLKAIAARFGIEIGEGSPVDVVYTNPVELGGWKWLAQARELVERTSSKRVLIDSISAMSLGSLDETQVGRLFYTAVKMFRSMGVTLIVTMETPALIDSALITRRDMSPMCGNIIMMRYVEIESDVRRAVSVVKMRGSSHETDLRELRISEDGVSVGESFKPLRGVLSGLPVPAQ